MKKENIKLLLGLCVVVLLFGMSFAELIVINNLSSQLSELQNHIDSLVNNIPTNITSTVIQKEESLIVSWNEEYGEINTDNHTVDYHVSITPKTITDDMQVYFSYHDTKYLMNKDNERFDVVIPLDLFREYINNEDVLIIIENNGEQKIERYPYSVSNIYDRFLPDFMVSASPVSHRETNNGLDVSFTAKMDFQDLSNKDIDFKKIVMITQLNDKVIQKEDKTKEIKESTEYSFGGYSFSDRRTYDASLDEDVLHIYFEATDEYGYIHRSTLAYIAPEDQFDYDMYDYGIYDKNGNLLLKR